MLVVIEPIVCWDPERAELGRLVRELPDLLVKGGVCYEIIESLFDAERVVEMSPGDPRAS